MKKFFFLFVFLCFITRANAQFSVEFSEKLDAAVFLNAISDDQRFNKGYAKIKKEWDEKIAADPEVLKVFQAWQGRGIQLAYLLSALPENGLEDTLAAFEKPESVIAVIREAFDEPAYQNVFDDFQKSFAQIKTWFLFLQKNAFIEFRKKASKQHFDSAKANLEKELSNINFQKYKDLLEAFTGKKISNGEPRIFILAFSQPYSFQLMRFAVGWDTTRDFSLWLLSHELLHKFNPSLQSLDFQKALAADDGFYGEAYGRIYDEFKEGKEEEFVEAAAQYMVQQLTPRTLTRALREIKLLYFSEKTNNRGVPLAMLIFQQLQASTIDLKNFDYNVFIEKLFKDGRLLPGEIEKLYKEAIKPVGGLLGLSLKAVPEGALVQKALSGFPAEQAGIKTGDIIMEANSESFADKNLDEILDLLAGESGKNFLFQVKRGDSTFSTEAVLK